MELTEFEVDSIYSRCLMELLQEGYVALFNYKWTLTNVNGKTTYVRKGSRWHDLKRA